MVKQSKKQQDKQGGAVDLGTVATPIVLYGLHALLKDDGKKTMDSLMKPMKKLSRGFGAKRGGAAEDGVATEMDMSVVTGAEETQEDFSNFQLGGKKPWGKKMMKKGGDQQDKQDQEQQDGGKKKQRKSARKQKGGDQEQQDQQDKQDQEQEQQDGGKKKQRKSARKQKGGDQEQQDQQDKQEQQDGGKKKQRKSARKQKGGDAFAALEDYYKMPLEQPAPVVDASDVSTQDAGVKTAPAPPAIPEVPTVPQAGGKKGKGKGKKGGSNALANVLQNMGVGMVNYDQFGNLAGAEQQGGALEQYTQQLQQLSERLDKMIREGGQKKQKK